MIPFISAKKAGLLISIILVLSEVSVNNTKESIHNLLPNLNHVNYLDRAYAHNDYEHPNPLFDALNLGFAFIEVDIHLLQDSLYVSHLRPLFPNHEKTLSKLYLEPLFKLQKLNNGSIYPNTERPLVLMVDIKTEAEATYQKLKNVLLPYKEM